MKTSVDQYCINVTDLANSVHFYEEVLGLSITFWFMSTGMDMGTVSAHGAVISDLLYPRINPVSVINAGLLLLFLTVVVAGFTAFRAARLKPVEALRYE